MRNIEKPFDNTFLILFVQYPGIRPLAHDEPQSAQQDRFTRSGLPGDDGQTIGEVDFLLLDDRVVFYDQSFYHRSFNNGRKDRKKWTGNGFWGMGFGYVVWSDLVISKIKISSEIA